MDVNGSPEYELTWKDWDMPSGLPVYVLLARAHRTSGNGCSGWPTPNHNTTGAGTSGRQGGLNLQSAAPLAGDPLNAEPALMMEIRRMPANSDTTLPAPNLSGWPTPQAEDSEQTGAHLGNPDTLNSATKLAGWATPQARDEKGVDQNFHHGAVNNSLPNQVSGLGLAGTPAPTASPGAFLRLNPFFSAWIQGYPMEWTLAGLRAVSRLRGKSKAAQPSSKDTGTRLSRSSRRSSSAPSST
jgi:hypothetical protein